MDLGNGLGHLTYSTLVHPGDDWETMWTVADHLSAAGEEARIAGNAAVRRLAPAVAISAATLSARASRARQAQEVPRRQRHVSLHRQRLRLRRLQERRSSRSRSTSRTGAARSARNTPSTSPTSSPMSCPEGIAPSIQSAPLGFKPQVTGERRGRELHRARHAGRRAPGRRWRSSTGRTVHAGARARAVLLSRDHRRDRRLFHQPSLHRRSRREAREARASADRRGASSALRRHLGIVFDICHQAVVYEDIPLSLQKLVDAGIPIFKLQEAAAMHMPK